MLDRGQELAAYILEEEIGGGGMGIVYRAYDEPLDRMVAVKLIKPELSADPVFHQRFDRERKAHASLNHANIVEIYRSGESEHGLYVAMRLIDGPSVGQLLESGPLGGGETLRILGPIAEALDFAHAKGPVHRDLKPQNILLDSSGQPFLTDFGLAWVPGQARMTTTGSFMGTTAYASPEQLLGLEASATSDVYSLACVLYECLTGEVPFHHDSHYATAIAHASEERPRPTAFDPTLPTSIDDVVSKGMDRDAERRFPSAGALLSAAAEALQAGDGSSAAPEDRRPAARRRGPGATRTGVRQRGQGQLTTGPQQAPPALADIDSRVAPLGVPPAAGKRNRYRPLVFALVLTALTAAGLLLGRSGGDASPAPVELTASARSGQIALRFPAAWQSTPSGRGIDGLRLQAPMFLRQRGKARTALSAGMVDAEGRLLLPRSLLRRLVAAPEQDAVVSAGGADAYLYADLRTRRSRRPFDLYVLPTSDGVATVVCHMRSDPAVAALCHRVVSSLVLRGASAYRLGPSLVYARVLNGVLADLERRWKDGGQALESAGTSAAQSTAAANLRAAFATASGRLRKTNVTPQSAAGNEAVADAFDRLGIAYGRLAAAAAAGSTSAYDEARAAVEEGKAGVRHTLRDLRSLGYRT